MKTTITLILLLLTAQNLLASTEFLAKVDHVVDGDTLKVSKKDNTKITIRLAEIDAPENSQPWGMEAKAALRRMVQGKEVSIYQQSVDRYGRSVAYVFKDDKLINFELVKNGHAWAYKDYMKTKKLSDIQRKAMNEKKGLWGNREQAPIAPWEWRKGTRTQDNIATRSPNIRPDNKPTMYEIVSAITSGNPLPNLENSKTAIAGMLYFFFFSMLAKKTKMLRKVPKKYSITILAASFSYLFFFYN